MTTDEAFETVVRLVREVSPCFPADFSGKTITLEVSRFGYRVQIDPPWDDNANQQIR